FLNLGTIVSLPGLDAAEDTVLFVDAPDCSHVPVETLADGFENQRRGICQCRRIGQYPCDSVLRDEPRLFCSPLGNIAPDEVHQPFFRQRRGCPEKPFERAVFAYHAIFEGHRVLAAKYGAHFSECSISILRMHYLNIGTREEFSTGVTE